jgi:soluble lytic murein transglycosylase-like protein
MTQEIVRRLRVHATPAMHRPRLLVAVLLAGVPQISGATSALAQTADPPQTVSARAHPYAAHVAEASQRFGVPEAWIWAVMRVESAGDPTAVSRAGAIGLMQVMPATYAELRARHGLGANPFDPRDNILAGTAYLRELHDRYGRDGVWAAYNAGPGRWEQYVLHGRSLPAETVAYMGRLGSVLGEPTVSPPVQIARADPLAWTRSSLFSRSVALTGDGSSDGPAELGVGTTIAAQTSASTQVHGAPSVSPPASPHPLFAVVRR